MLHGEEQSWVIGLLFAVALLSVPAGMGYAVYKVTHEIQEIRQEGPLL